MFSLFHMEGEGFWRLSLVLVRFDVSIPMILVLNFCPHYRRASGKTSDLGFPQMHSKMKGLYLFIMDSVTCMRDVLV